MKKTLGFVAVVALSGLITVSCSSLNKMKKRAGEITYSVTPETLVAKGGMVDLKIDVTFPAKYFNKKVAIEATPVLRFKGGEKAYEMKAIQGEKVQGNAEVIPYETGKTVSYMSRIPYEDAMRLSDLEIDITGTKGAKTVKFDPRKIGDGVIATETLVVNAPATSVGEDKFQRIIKQQEEAAIYYLINSANIRSKEMTSEEMKKLEAYIKEAAAKENMNLNGIDVRSYASPDGAYDFNEKLANQREKSSSTFLKKQMKKGKVDQYKDENFFKNFVVAEDWDGFKKAMEESNIIFPLKKRIEDDSGFCGSDLSRTDGRLYRKSDVFRERLVRNEKSRPEPGFAEKNNEYSISYVCVRRAVGRRKYRPTSRRKAVKCLPR